MNVDQKLVLHELVVKTFRVDIKVNLGIKNVVELVMFKDKKIKKRFCIWVMIYMIHGNMDTGEDNEGKINQERC